MGSSHIHCDVNTAYLWQNYGISGYDYSAAEQPLWITYYFLKEICKTQSPKLIVLDLFAPASFTDDYQYDFMPDNLYGMNFSLNKLQMILTCCEFDKITEYFPTLFGSHTRYTELDETDKEKFDLSNKDMASFKGFTPYFGKTKTECNEIITDEHAELTEKTRTYLQKIIDYTNENGIELYLIVSPYISTYEEETAYNTFKAIANENNIIMDNMNHHYANMGFIPEKHLFDNSHLNYSGSKIFSDYLGKKIKEYYDIEDHRGDPYYSSWDDGCLEIEKIVSEHKSKKK
ncbi:MAG: hypothetical protein K6B41_08570 [Butyrivibrio sp.]|nr:hypothetical protein [Butyrivibrio sp.]